MLQFISYIYEVIKQMSSFLSYRGQDGVQCWLWRGLRLHSGTLPNSGQSLMIYLQSLCNSVAMFIVDQNVFRPTVQQFCIRKIVEQPCKLYDDTVQCTWCLAVGCVQLFYSRFPSLLVDQFTGSLVNCLLRIAMSVENKTLFSVA